ncbi:MAG: hypothetical protein K5770_13810 [Lachnospiraceae bacterium]|nr:hypothetical protein [Lachnospiraceae bacterium]
MSGKNKQIQKQNLSYTELMGQKEVDQYEKNMFKLNTFGGQKEADALIARYRKYTTLSADDEKILRDNVPAAPSFTIESKAEYNNKWDCNKNRYRKKVRKYFNDRKNYYNRKAEKGSTPSRGEIYAKKREEIELRIKQTHKYFNTTAEDAAYKCDELLEKGKNLGYYQDIEEMARSEMRDLTEVMDEQYDKLANDQQYEEIERELGANELKVCSNGNGEFLEGVKAWTGGDCASHKKIMHGGRYLPMFENVKETLTNRPLSRDVVVRRGNNSFHALALALGMDASHPLKVDPDKVKEVLKQRIAQGGELVLKETAMMSTAFPFAKRHYEAGSGSDDFGKIGIEYIILAKKGTAAANVMSDVMYKEEGELLIAQNTKFRIIKAEVDGEAEIKHGYNKSWKIYMVTVPENEQGIKNNETEVA